MALGRNITHVPPGDIKVLRDERQRREFDTEDLEASIRRNGILNPLIVREDLTLVAGERRLQAAIAIGLTEVPVRSVGNLSPGDLQILELEENIKRKDLSWQDVAMSVQKIYRIQLAQDPEVTQADLAESLGLSRSYITSLLRVAGELEQPRIQSASTYREAWNILQRQDSRTAGDLLQELVDMGHEEQKAQEPKAPQEPLVFGSTSPSAAPVAAPKAAPPPPINGIHCQDFTRWVRAYRGPKFNVIHCDFPYGVDLFSGPLGQKIASRAAGGEEYDDSEGAYFGLLEVFLKNFNSFASLSCHLLFWYSAANLPRTKELFAQHRPEVVFSPHPLIWHKTDNAGIASDPRRRPRHIHETCLLASRGDRQLVRSLGDTYGAPTDRTLHPSAKPEPMLKHFLSMVIDEQTQVFDPTCGGGSSLRAAEALGASRALGLELDPKIAALAQEALRRSRQLQKLAKEAKAQGQGETL